MVPGMGERDTAGHIHPGMGEGHCWHIPPGYIGGYTTQGIYQTIPPRVHHPATLSVMLSVLHDGGVSRDEALGSEEKKPLGESLLSSQRVLKV